MRLPLRRLRIGLLAGLLGASLLAAGCASGSPTRRIASPVFLSARHQRPGGTRAAIRAHQRTLAADNETAAMVVDRIHAAGFRFGTDGTAGALWGYMRTSHELVEPDGARAGDVVFFDTLSHDDSDLACADRLGIVVDVDARGRITFVEARDGQLQRGYVDPHQPLARRGERGEILNSFLRPKRLSDPDGTRYFAGEMLCGIARVRPR